VNWPICAVPGFVGSARPLLIRPCSSWMDAIASLLRSTMVKMPTSSIALRNWASMPSMTRRSASESFVCATASMTDGFTVMRPIPSV
jgi:hypothetical protein